MTFHLFFQSMISILWEFYVWKRIFKQILFLSMAWQPTMRSKEQKDLSNMTKHVKKYQDKEPITERMTATAEKAREVKQWKSQSKTDRKTEAWVASRLSRAVAGRGFGSQKNTCYLRTREQWIMPPTKRRHQHFKQMEWHTSHSSQEKLLNLQT